MAGYILLFDLLGERRSHRLEKIVMSTGCGELETDEAFVDWLRRETERDPSLVKTVRGIFQSVRDAAVREISTEVNQGKDQ